MIGAVNDLLRRYGTPGILLTLIGVFLLLLSYLPYLIGMLIVVLVGYLIYRR